MHSRTRERSSSGSSNSHGRHSHQPHSSSRSSHHPKERGRRHHRESRREKVDPYLVSPSSKGEPLAVAAEAEGGRSGGRRGGGFEMGVVSRTQEESSPWFQPSSSAGAQATPISPTAPYMSTLGLTQSTKAEYEFPLMGEIEGEKKAEPHLSLWKEGWKPSNGTLSCTIPKLHEPVPAMKPAADSVRISSALDFPRDRDGNNIILHGMGLQSYIQEVREMIACLPDDSVLDSSSLENLPKKPTKLSNPDTKLPLSNPLTPPAMVPQLSLNKQSIGKLQRKSVAAMCSFSGYESSSPEALEVLSDLLGGFMSNFTRFLKINADRTPGGQEGCRGFRDTLDRSLHQVGMGGRAGLRQYWQKSVVDYTRQLDMWAEEYKNTYLRMTVPEEKVQASSSAETSNAFTDSKLFSDDQPSEEEMSLDSMIQESRIAIATQGVNRDSPNVPPALDPITDPDIIPPESEGFVSLEIDGPPMKRIRTVSLDQ